MKFKKIIEKCRCGRTDMKAKRMCRRCYNKWLSDRHRIQITDEMIKGKVSPYLDDEWEDEECKKRYIYYHGI